jgi:rod shape-determining protein MreD
MKRFGFFAATLFVGALSHFFCQRYLSLPNAAPDVLLLLTAANGFACGPMTGQLLGFCWGIIGDASGTELFGVSAFSLALVGFLAGALRRRVASERVTAQLVIGLVATISQAVVWRTLLAAFESGGRGSFFAFILQCAMNVVFVPWVFLATERWLDIWAIEREHV